ncbi:MAG: lysophospholipid acyltransferase family protein [Pseudomonadales bacterium]
MDAERDTLKPFSEAWFEQHIDNALAATPPDTRFSRSVYKLIKFAFDPQFFGLENLPDRGCLFIGNHSLFALDGGLLGAVMLNEHGRWLRGLGDRFLWTTAKTEDFIIENGGVCGDPRVCDALMENDADLMVFPGGAHEAAKSEDQKYQLQWKERYGFVRMAAKHGYPIIPIALVGPDEFYRHLVEGKDLPDTAAWKALVRLGVIDKDMRPDLIPPIPLGMLGSPLPKPQRCYVKFGKPVLTSDYVGREMTATELRKVREKVARQIEKMIRELLLLREQQRSDDSLLRRILTL